MILLLSWGRDRVAPNISTLTTLVWIVVFFFIIFFLHLLLLFWKAYCICVCIWKSSNFQSKNNLYINEFDKYKQNYQFIIDFFLFNKEKLRLNAINHVLYGKNEIFNWTMPNNNQKKLWKLEFSVGTIYCRWSCWRQSFSPIFILDILVK